MSNIRTQNWLLSRRHVLRGVGATVALPLLDCMRPLRARAAEAASKPRRSVFVYIPNGVNVLTWQITKAGRDYQFSEPMMPLDKHRQNLTPSAGCITRVASARRMCAPTPGSRPRRSAWRAALITTPCPAISSWPK